MVVAFSAVGIFTSLLGVFTGEKIFYLLCLQGALSAALTSIVYIAVAKVAPAGRKSSLISLFASVSFFVGTGIVPQVIAFLNAWNLVSYGFIIMGLGALMSSVAIFI